MTDEHRLRFFAQEKLAEGGYAMSSYLEDEPRYDSLTVKDLLEAREAYHNFLVKKKHVVGTAVGRIRKRKEGVPDSDPKTLSSTELNPKSWPCLMVFVDGWQDLSNQPIRIKSQTKNPDEFNAEDLVPELLYLPDGRVIPTCVLRLDFDNQDDGVITRMRFPASVVGGGYPVFTEVQGERRWATLGCLVSDGRLTYGLTNAHVAGRPGEKLSTLRYGKEAVIGSTSTKQLKKMNLPKVYEDFPGRHELLNLDIGLVELEDIHEVTANIFGLGELKGLVDVNYATMSLNLIGCPVKGFGCSSGLMEGEIIGLFYRYKSTGGYDYVCDYLIGQRSAASPEETYPFAPRHGDSGTVLVVDSPDQKDFHMKAIGILWGGQKDKSNQCTSTYGLATNLGTVCRLLDMEVVSTWNTGYDEYFGAFAHVTLPGLAVDYITNPKLKQLMQLNMEYFSLPFNSADISAAHGLSKNDKLDQVVLLSDVPDLIWKGYTPWKRGKEGNNHFADLDQQDPTMEGKTLLQLSTNPDNITPQFWNKFYQDIIDGERKAGKKSQTRKGELPFRIAQIYDEMVEYVKSGNVDAFVTSAGIITHYIFDSCQPMHLSYMFDGDPNGATIGSDGKQEPVTAGIHAIFDEKMVELNVNTLRTDLTGYISRATKRGVVPSITSLKTSKKVAQATIGLMRDTIKYAEPVSIVRSYEQMLDLPNNERYTRLWTQFGTGMEKAIGEAIILTARIWDSAWKRGGGDKLTDIEKRDPQNIIKLYRTKEGFLNSYNLEEMSSVLKW
jgi:hypothetical protein